LLETLQGEFSFAFPIAECLESFEASMARELQRGLIRVLFFLLLLWGPRMEWWLVLLLGPSSQLIFQVKQFLVCDDPCLSLGSARHLIVAPVNVHPVVVDTSMT
jgi:hypothetical protein